METWTQERQTKLGLAAIKIVQVQDLYEATVSFVNEGIGGAVFEAIETFGDARCAFLWAYGLKQSINDNYAGYGRKGNELVELKPKKGKVPIILSIEEGIASVRNDYDNFELGRTSTSKGDTISVSQVKSSTLSPDEQIVLLALMAKAKARVKNV